MRRFSQVGHSLILALSYVGSSLSTAEYDIVDDETSVNQPKSLIRSDNTSPKYFHESLFSSHYDVRYGHKQLQYYNQRSHLSVMIKAYLSTMNDIGAETWLMHGSLLGWYWNQKILPWDKDIDVQMTEKSMQHLVDYYNMTMHYWDIPGLREGRNFLLEINPNWKNGSVDDVGNKIDARWLDTTTGLYIDITVLRWDREAQSSGNEGAMMCKDGHRYTHNDIFPLRTTTFEATPAKVPFAYANVLAEEYGPSSLTDSVYERHQFDSAMREWIPIGSGQQEE